MRPNRTGLGNQDHRQGYAQQHPNRTFTVQFFSNPSSNEGKTYLGQRNATTDANGNASFTFGLARAIPLGQTVTATATDALTGDTSEFSAQKVVQQQ